MADREEIRSGQSLRRALGRTSATFLTAAMIIGTGLFAALGATAEKAGSSCGRPLAGAPLWHSALNSALFVCVTEEKRLSNVPSRGEP